MAEIVKNFLNNQTVFFVIITIMLVLFSVCGYYSIAKGRDRNKLSDQLDIYEEKVTLANEIQKCRIRFLKLDLIPSLGFIAGVLCILFSLGLIKIESLNTQRKLFYAGWIVVGICIIIYMIRFLLNGGIKSLKNMTDYAGVEYKKPEYRTYEVY